MAMQWDNAKTISQPRIHVFLYGASGAGKTEQAASFPEPMLVSPANENGVLTLMGRDIPFKRITGSKDLLDVIEGLEVIQRKNPDDLPGQTFIFDSISHYAELVVEEIAKTRKGGMDMQGWGELGSHFRVVQQRLRNLDLHVVYTALADVLTSDTGGVIGGKPRLSGSTGTMLPSACDITAFMDVRDSVQAQERTGAMYRIYTRPKGGYSARTRFPGVPAEILLGTAPGTRLWDHLAPHVSGAK